VNIDLVGLLEDGSPPLPARLNPRITLVVPLYSDVVLSLSVVTPSGESVPLGDAALVLTAKKAPSDGIASIRKVATFANGKAIFTLAPADTKQLAAGRYVFDVVMTRGGKRDSVVPLSTLVLEAAATPAP